MTRMSRGFWVSRVLFAALVGGLLSASAFDPGVLRADAPGSFLPSESILPATTRLWVSMRDPDGVRDTFNKTRFGQLLADPVMKPFVTSFREQVRNAGRQRLKKLGLTLEDLEKIPSGELAIACVESKPNVASVVLLVDAKGREKELAALVAQITTRIGEQGGRRLAEQPKMPQLVAFELAEDPEHRSPRKEYAAFASSGSALVIGDDVAVVAEAFGGLAKGRPDSLESLAAFRPVMEQTAKKLPAGKPPVRWYIDPLGYAGLMETLADERQAAGLPAGAVTPSKSTASHHRSAILRRNGFDAIKGAGGHVVFDVGNHEIFHQSLVYAPPLPGKDPFGPDRFSLSGRMMRFPNASSIVPPEWIPRDIGAWTAFEWDMKTAFLSAKPIVDDMAGEKGVYEDILASLKEDPDGPQIEVERDLIDALGTRVVVISDHVEPIDPDADRLVIAIEAKDPELLAKTIEKSMKSESDMRRVEHGGHAIWELVEKDVSIPKLEIETSVGKVAHADSGRDTEDHKTRRERRREREERMLPHSAVTVAHGHLFIGSHLDFLQKVLDTSGGPEAIASSADCKAVVDELGRLFPSQTALRSFGRAEKTIRPTYEAIKHGWMPSSKSLFSQILNDVLGDGKPGTVRRQQIDGSKLPEFDLVRKYFGTTGIGVETVEEGWLVRGFALARGPQDPEVARRPVAPVGR